MKTQRLFIWHGVNMQGDSQQGELAAKNRRDALQQLITLGCYPTQLKKGAKLNKRCWQSTIRTATTRQLATLLQAGLPLANSLTLLAQQSETPAWRYLLNQLQQQVTQGTSFSEALAAYPDAFPPLFQQLIATGELTGQLDRCCLQLAEQQERVLQIQKKISRALRYPLFVLVIALLVTLLMLLVVLPEFSTIYQSFDAPLPWFTQSIMQLSAALRDYGSSLLLLMSGLSWTYLKQLHPKVEWKKREQFCLMRLPLCRSLLLNGCLSRLFRTLAMTQASGITLLEGLHAAANTAGNLFYQDALQQIQHFVRQGEPLHESLRKQPLFPALSQQMIRVGEESGTLENMLEKLAHHYEQQAENCADQLSQSLEPMLMIVVGSIVGALVIAMYLPIFQLGDVMK